MFGKPPFSYADPPNLGDKRDPNYNGETPTFGYNYPPHVPIHPGRWNDTEPAWVQCPGQPCCPEDADECLCITSADTSKWDSVYNTVSGNSAAWGGDLVLNSAYWQSTYETVSANSAKWDEATELDLTDLSARWESAFNAVSACNELIGTYSGQKSIITQSPIYGDGTVANPISLDENLAAKMELAYKLVHELIYQLYGNTQDIIKENYQQWLNLDALDEANRRIGALNTSAAMFQNEVIKLWDAIRRLQGVNSRIDDLIADFEKRLKELKGELTEADKKIISQLTGVIRNTSGNLYQVIKQTSAVLNAQDIKNYNDLYSRINNASSYLVDYVDTASAYVYNYFDGMSANLINYTNNVSSYLYNVEANNSAKQKSYIDKTSAYLYNVDVVTSAELVELIKNTSGNLYQIDKDTSAALVEMINNKGDIYELISNTSSNLYNIIYNVSGKLDKRLETSANYLYKTIDDNSAKLYNLIVLGDEAIQANIDALSAYIKDNETKWTEPIYVRENDMTIDNYNQYTTAGTIYFNVYKED